MLRTRHALSQARHYRCYCCSRLLPVFLHHLPEKMLWPQFGESFSVDAFEFRLKLIWDTIGPRQFHPEIHRQLHGRHAHVHLAMPGPRPQISGMSPRQSAESAGPDVPFTSPEFEIGYKPARRLPAEHQAKRM